MRFPIIVLILSLFFAMSTSARAEELANRYQVINEGGMIILLDSSTGKTWRFSEPLEWHPMTFMRSGDAAVAPEDSKSAIKKWQEEFESRKLELMDSGLDTDDGG